MASVVIYFKKTHLYNKGLLNLDKLYHCLFFIQKYNLWMIG